MKKMNLLKKRTRQHSRKKLGSNNRKKSSLKLSRLHRRIKNIRKDFLHKLTTRLAKTKSVIVLEDLSVRGMMKNRYLARSISDAGWRKFRSMLEYKTVWFGSTLIVAPKFFASSKICSSCGYVLRNLSLSIRGWTCPVCGIEHDRDLNAARNLLRISTGSSPGSYACGDPSVGACSKTG
jgi:putative transposase